MSMTRVPRGSLNTDVSGAPAAAPAIVSGTTCTVGRDVLLLVEGDVVRHADIVPMPPGSALAASSASIAATIRLSTSGSPTLCRLWRVGLHRAKVRGLVIVDNWSSGRAGPWGPAAGRRVRQRFFSFRAPVSVNGSPAMRHSGRGCGQSSRVELDIGRDPGQLRPGIAQPPQRSAAMASTESTSVRSRRNDVAWPQAASKPGT